MNGNTQMEMTATVYSGLNRDSHFYKWESYVWM